MNIWTHIHTLLEHNTCCALVSISHVEGSTPRELWARMVVEPGGDIYGTIGGGAMEMQAIKQAQEMLKLRSDQIDKRTYILGPDLGQCCGGTVDILTETFASGRLAEVTQLKQWESQGIFTTQGETTQDRVIREVTDEVSNNELVETFGDVRHPLYIFGAGHVGHALMHALAPLPFDVTWIDTRSDVFPQVIPHNYKTLQVDEPHTHLSTAPDGAYIIILTHDHDIDFAIAEAAIRAERFAYIGVIGSKTKGARFRSRLNQAGLSPEQINMMTCPIGIDSIRSKKPEAIAVSVVADLLARIEN